MFILRDCIGKLQVPKKHIQSQRLYNDLLKAAARFNKTIPKHKID